MNPSFDISDKHKILRKDLKNIIQVFLFIQKEGKTGKLSIPKNIPLVLMP
jgi:hypothetical protein